MKVCCSDVANNNTVVFYSIGDVCYINNRSMIELYIKDRLEIIQGLEEYYGTPLIPRSFIIYYKMLSGDIIPASIITGSLKDDTGGVPYVVEGYDELSLDQRNDSLKYCIRLHNSIYPLIHMNRMYILVKYESNSGEGYSRCRDYPLPSQVLYFARRPSLRYSAQKGDHHCTLEAGKTPCTRAEPREKLHKVTGSSNGKTPIFDVGN